MLLENVRIALRAIGANKMRSIFTVLGVMIGVAAVIAVVSLVQGLQHKISADLENVGSTFIRVIPDLGVQRNPFLQFLIETVALSGFGGAVGTVGGVGLANIIRLLLRRWVELPAVHTPIWAIAIAFGFCAFLGILFGTHPAARASKLDPH